MKTSLPKPKELVAKWRPSKNFNLEGCRNNEVSILSGVPLYSICGRKFDALTDKNYATVEILPKSLSLKIPKILQNGFTI